MDTKSKKNKGFWAWFSFFMGLNLVVLGLGVGLCLPWTLNYEIEDMGKILSGEDVKSLSNFKEQMGQHLSDVTMGLLGQPFMATDRPASSVIVYATEEMSFGTATIESATNVAEDVVAPATPIVATREERFKQIADSLDREGENLLYDITDSSGQVLSNFEQRPTLNDAGDVVLQQGYDYALYFDGQQVVASEQMGLRLISTDPHRKDSGYDYNTMGRYFAGSDYMKQNPTLKDCRIILMVKDLLVDNPYGSSSLYRLEQRALWGQILMVGTLTVIVLGGVLLLAAFLKRRDKRRFDRFLGETAGKLWLEVKIFLGFFGCMGFFVGISLADSGWMGMFERLIGLGMMGMSGWWLYLMLMDLIVNKGRFFSHNSIGWFVKSLKKTEQLKAFQDKMLARAYRLVIAEVVLAFIAAFTFYTVIIPLCAFGLGIYLILWYLKQYKAMVVDIGLVCDQIERIKQGDMVTPLILAKEADLAFAAGYLNSIQEGITIATDEKVKSERMKVDLVTNVSHDLKTPLTSIISYVDLLDKEEGLSPVAQDYVRILGQKSQRLKSLINDLFDLSKATSANLEVDLERIDLGKLMRQVEADLEEEMTNSGLTFKISIPGEAVMIQSDGSKLHRIFENLILNTLKYSLVGSRVFMDMVINEGKVWVIIKNIANYEMDFDVEAITGRFVRGDKARTTEGSGLGLAIAESYTVACGGVFEIIIDGDMFKVELMFELA